MNDNDNEKVAYIREILNKATPVTGKATDRSKKEEAENTSGVVVVKGDNIGEINVNVTKQSRTNFIPTEQHITPDTALKIKDIITNLVEKDVASGEDRAKSYRRWWSYLNRTYNVTTYKEIPRDMGESAVKWLQQNSARTRTKIRRRDNSKWRAEHYTGIWARSSEIGLSKADVYKIVYDRLGKNVASLKSLSDRNLKQLYQIIMKA